MFSRAVRRAGSLAAAIVLLSSTAALAEGRQTVTETVHEHDVVLFSEPSPNPCTGDSGTISGIARNGVFHATFFEGGDEFWITGTYEGTATFTPDDPEAVSASGHFAAWFGAAGNERNEVETNTFTMVLTGSDGSHIVVHGTVHANTNARGEVVVSFEKEGARCS
jgi:hypothetical protein